MIMTWNTKWQLTFVMISFKLNWVGRYLVFFQHHRLLFFTTTQRTSQREEEFKSTIGCRVDRPVSLTNCFEQHSKSAILEIVNQKIKGDRGGSWEVFWRGRRAGKIKIPLGYADAEYRTRGRRKLASVLSEAPFSIVKHSTWLFFIAAIGVSQKDARSSQLQA